MPQIKFDIIKPGDTERFELIAEWYLNEWNIPVTKTIENLQKITNDKRQFQVLMTYNGLPIATGGIYNHVGILDKEPKFKIHKHWLALIYTLPEQRKKGYGALLCDFIQNYSQGLGLEYLHLYTDTAERLYEKLGWMKVEKLQVENRKIVIMNKKLKSKKILPTL